jgi:hypothetical protein
MVSLWDNGLSLVDTAYSAFWPVRAVYLTSFHPPSLPVRCQFRCQLFQHSEQYRFCLSGRIVVFAAEQVTIQIKGN